MNRVSCPGNLCFLVESQIKNTTKLGTHGLKMLSHKHRKQVSQLVIVGVFVFIFLNWNTREHTSKETFLEKGTSFIGTETAPSCKKYFDNLYTNEPLWNNDIITMTDSSSVGILKVSKMIERIAMFGKCQNIVKRYDNLQERVVPFLNPSKIPNNWPKFDGKGITMMVHKKEIEVAKRSIRVIRMHSDLPIEIFHLGDVSADTPFGKNVKIIDASSYINPKYSLKSYFNKWIALLFSSFEEVIFTEPDVVFVKSPEEIFELNDDTTLLFRGRHFSPEVSLTCRRFLDELPRGDLSSSTETKFGNELEYNLFFKNHETNNIDGGLVVTNKKNQLGSLLTSFMLNLIAVTRDCYEQDGDYQFLGHILSDMPVNVHPENASLAGRVIRNRLCSTQLCHTSQGQIIWCNGGFRTCNVDNAWNNPVDIEYWGNYQFSIEEIKEMYNSPVKLDMTLIPYDEGNPLENFDGLCGGKMFCAHDSGCKKFTYSGTYAKNLQTFIDAWNM